jgi:O-antigen/teichoic acid export membrane protein
MRRSAFFFRGRPLRVATAFALQVAGLGLSFLFSILLARLIGVAGLGLYFLAITIVDIGASIARLGLENAGLRFASIAYTVGDRGTLAALYRTSMSLALAAGIVIALPLWLIVSHLPLGGTAALELRAELPLVVLAVAPLALLVIQAEFLKGIGGSNSGTFSQAVVPPLLLLCGGLAMWVLNLTSLHGILLTYLAVAVAATGHAIALWTWHVPDVWRAPGRFDTRLLLRTGTPLLLVTGLNLILGWTDILVLGVWADPSQTGIYGICMRIALLSTFVLGAINVVVAPQFASLHAAGNAPALRRLAQQSAFWATVVAAPLLVVLLLVPDLILQLFGPQFKEGVWTLRILALGQMVNLATGPVGTLLLMTGHEKTMRNNVAACAAFNLVGNLLLVPFWGATGAAISTAFALALMNIVSWIMVRKKLDIDILDYRALRGRPCARP